jgi:endonuclease VIII
MEGPSLYLAAEQLAPFIGRNVLSVKGNTRIGKERLKGLEVIAIFSWGKHLVFQFKDFALRVHFMLFGSFEAVINGKKVTGDYPKKQMASRLELSFKKGKITLYSCSLKYLESSWAKDTYDFSIDTMSADWDSKAAFKKIKKHPNEEISDVLLDQTLFAGVGNIIRNEVLFLTHTLPDKPISKLSDASLKKIIETVRFYVFQFYEWRKHFVLKKHYQIYRQSVCPICHQRVTRKKTGKRKRISFSCTHCQK